MPFNNKEIKLHFLQLYNRRRCPNYIECSANNFRNRLESTVCCVEQQCKHQCCRLHITVVNTDTRLTNFSKQVAYMIYKAWTNAKQIRTMNSNNNNHWHQALVANKLYNKKHTQNVRFVICILQHGLHLIINP